MRRKFIPVEESFANWRKNPNYLREYDSLEEEFALTASLIDARVRAGARDRRPSFHQHEQRSRAGILR